MPVLFSRACEYAVRGLIVMARNPEKESWRIPDIAKESETPSPFLAKTFQSLVRGGILHSTKGRNGGFRFARPVEEIALIDVVEIIDGGRLTHDCALGMPDCNDDNPCPFHTQWRRIRLPLIDALKQESLARLAKGLKSKVLDT